MAWREIPGLWQTLFLLDCEIEDGYSLSDEYLDRCELNRLQEAFEAGHRYSLLHAIRFCAASGILMPSWVARAFIVAFDKVHKAEAKSWDTAFGSPYRKGIHLGKIRRDQALAMPLRERAGELIDGGSAIDDSLFSQLGAEFNIGKTRAAELFYALARSDADIANEFEAGLGLVVGPDSGKI